MSTFCYLWSWFDEAWPSPGPRLRLPCWLLPPSNRTATMVVWYVLRYTLWWAPLVPSFLFYVLYHRAVPILCSVFVQRCFLSSLILVQLLFFYFWISVWMDCVVGPCQFSSLYKCHQCF
jgi:hypothetical protein